MIDGSEKRLNLELESRHVIERHSNIVFVFIINYFYLVLSYSFS